MSVLSRRDHPIYCISDTPGGIKRGPANEAEPEDYNVIDKSSGAQRDG